MIKPHIQKLPLNENISFVAKTFRTPHFEVGWHQHIEYELILFTEGTGLSFIGNHVGEFETGDVYFLGSNLPHTFQKRDPEALTSAVVVQFRDDFWGPQFLELPESRELLELMKASKQGIKLSPAMRRSIAPLIRELEVSKGFERLLLLGRCLYLMTEDQESTIVSTSNIKHTKDERIDQVFQYTINNFKEHIRLSQVADIACMSVQNFCAYFKRSTRKTYIDFLNEVRIGYACNLLIDTQKSVLAICYASGYNTMANFHKQFLKVKGITPLQFRKAFMPG